MKKMIWILLILLLALAACGGEDIPPTETPAPATAAVATPTEAVIEQGEATVESIQLLILESFPVQVNVIARGILADGCTTIDDITTVQDGAGFLVTIATLRDPNLACTEAVVPFEETIPLPVEGLAAGNYTVSVNGMMGSFSLAVDNVPGAEPTEEPTATAEPAGATINGRVWHDLCAPTPTTDDAPPPGCIADPDGGFEANGLLEEDEPGIEGIVLNIGSGTCPATGLAEATTDTDGNYNFTGLAPGIYCVAIDPLSETNEPILLPGGFTAPDNLGEAEITVEEGQDVADVNFGWDYQFLPLPEVDEASCTKIIQFLEDVTIPDDTRFNPGEEFVKTWRLRNGGTCPWTTDYTLLSVSGDEDLAVAPQPLPQPVAPGQTIDLSVTLTAPEAFGTYRSNWQIADAEGNPFGVGGDIGEAFWVQIVVDEPQPTPEPNSSTIGGVVWQDICVLNNSGEPVRGCLETAAGSGFYIGDGTLNFGEPRLAGITVTLTDAACTEDGVIPPADVVATTTTDADGLYRFLEQPGGIYCIYIDALSDANVDLLIPGNWTWPAPGVGRQGIRLAEGEERLEIDFGWEFD